MFVVHLRLEPYLLAVLVPSRTKRVFRFWAISSEASYTKGAMAKTPLSVMIMVAPYSGCPKP